MATNLAQTPKDRREHLELHLAPEAVHVPGILEAEVGESAPSWQVERVHPRRLARGVVGVLVALLAPLLVLLAALSLPVAEPVRGAVLVVGWVTLGVVARIVSDRRDPELRG